MPYLSRRFGTHLPGCSLTVRFIGLGQSAIDQAMKDHLPLSDEIALSSQFDASRVDFTFTLPDDNRENRAKLEDLKMRLLERLGDNIYATDDRTSLEDSAVAALVARGATPRSPRWPVAALRPRPCAAPGNAGQRARRA